MDDAQGDYQATNSNAEHPDTSTEQEENQKPTSGVGINVSISTMTPPQGNKRLNIGQNETLENMQTQKGFRMDIGVACI